MDYRVELTTYTGPIDLLLYLVRRHEVDVTDLPIAKITAQFGEFLEVLELIDFDLVGEFVVLASTLVEIKSRMVLPRPEEEEAPEVDVTEDPRSELVRQLLEYKKFKDAAKLLEDQAALWQQRYPRLSDERPAGGKGARQDHIKDVELWDLVSAFSRIVRQIDPEEQKSIVYDDTPISVYIDRVGKRVKQDQRVAFSAFFEGSNSKSKIVGIFLAILELLRNYYFRAVQEDESGEIWVMPPDPNRPPPAESETNAPMETAEIADSASAELPAVTESGEAPLPPPE
ncbi:Segregation and condensation protein A [Symmachiella macrocystis]|uniref:Segregation and condensation protein A n=1 Tax=Symmachiella macrocystis TaxID=2527985 RepID=A0A5C6BCK6_9PLAN|nr:segregation/condensation protein A [Symmachiella macrocystis]TWU09036.1 Segregation and condensation protein A [Symmachiella macrocystis]